MNIFEPDSAIIDNYVEKLLSQQIIVPSVNVARGETGNHIMSSILVVKNQNPAETFEYRARYILTHIVTLHWNNFKHFRLFLKDFWNLWEEYLVMKLR